MKANTALCFLLAGISLNLQTRKRRILTTRIAAGCAIAVGAIGLITLCEYLFGWNLGIDEVLIGDLVATIESDPGRMGFNAAIDFGLTGAALWLTSRQDRLHRVKLDRIAIAQSLATGAGLIALQAVVSYANNVRVFYQLSIFTTAMTLQTAIVFIALCGGILALNSVGVASQNENRGWMQSLTSDLVGGDVARRFLPLATAIPVLVGWLILRGHQANFYDTNFAFSLMSVSLVGILLGLIRLNAGTLNRVDEDRLRASELIRSSEERLQFALHGANQGIWEFDIQTQAVTWDDRCKAIFGLSPDAQLTYAQRIEMLHPEDRHRVIQTLKMAIDECGEFAQEYRTIYPDGTIRWVLSQGRGYCNISGQRDRILGTVMDITERKQSEAALREGEERFRTLADGMSQFAWMADATGSIFWYNRRWFDYTGTTLSQMQGWGWQQVHHPEHVERVVAHFRQSLATGEEWEDTFPLRGRDGTYRWFLSRAIPIVDATGRAIRWFGTNTDITEQQTLLQERQQAQADLEQRNQALDAFGYIVAHDLKAPLRGIANLSEWIEADLAGVITPDTQRQMTLLRNRVHRMEAIVNGLLDYARVGRLDDPSESVEMSQLLAEIVDSLAPPPTFKIEIAPNLPTLHTKRLFLSQVLTNLISNGIKHHDRVDGTIHITIVERSDVYEFAIADDGPGIPPEQHERVFKIFQAMNPQNRPDSTGIGLAIVKKIVEAEGGTIHIESQLGRGTTFYFTWPKGAEISA
jgi:PAS domain S-box-containing protein